MYIEYKAINFGHLELGVLTPNLSLLVFMPLCLLIMKIEPEASTEIIETSSFQPVFVTGSTDGCSWPCQKILHHTVVAAKLQVATPIKNP